MKKTIVCLHASLSMPRVVLHKYSSARQCCNCRTPMQCAYTPYFSDCSRVDDVYTLAQIPSKTSVYLRCSVLASCAFSIHFDP